MNMKDLFGFEPLQNHNAIDAEFQREKFFRKSEKKNRNNLERKPWQMLMKDLINEKEAYSLNSAMKRGASCWLNAFPLKRYFDLTKGEFRHGIALRYGLDSSTCACGENFNIAHALHCPKGGYSQIRHNENRDPCQPAQRGLR